jgi:hypothetical protein
VILVPLVVEVTGKSTTKGTKSTKKKEGVKFLEVGNNPGKHPGATIVHNSFRSVQGHFSKCGALYCYMQQQ